MQSGNAAYVLGRATLGGRDAPEVRILVDGGAITFSKGAWSANVPEFVIYDGTFVSENVFSGETVDIDQRRGLFRVIVGTDGVRLAKEIEELDKHESGESSRSAKRELQYNLSFRRA